MRVKTLSSLVAVTGMLVSFAAQAQDAPAGGEATPAAPPPAAVAVSTGAKGLVGVDVLAAFPFGNLADGAGIGFGGLVRGEYGVMPQLNVTARIGYVHHLAKNEITFSEIPIWLGAKYGFTDQIYGAAEIGLVHAKASFGDLSQRRQPRLHHRRWLSHGRHRRPRRSPHPGPRQRWGLDRARGQRRLQLLQVLSFEKPDGQA